MLFTLAHRYIFHNSATLLSDIQRRLSGGDFVGTSNHDSIRAINLPARCTSRPNLRRAVSYKLGLADDVFLARVVVEVAHVLLMMAVSRTTTRSTRSSDRCQRMIMLVDIAATSLVATASLAGDEPAGGGEEGLDGGGVDGDDGDKGLADGPDGGGVDTFDIPETLLAG